MAIFISSHKLQFALPDYAAVTVFFASALVSAPDDDGDVIANSSEKKKFSVLMSCFICEIGPKVLLD